MDLHVLNLKESVNQSHSVNGPNVIEGHFEHATLL